MKKYLPEIGITLVILGVFFGWIVPADVPNILLRVLHWVSAAAGGLFVSGAIVYTGIKIAERADKSAPSYYFFCVLVLLMVLLALVGVRTLSDLW